MKSFQFGLILTVVMFDVRFDVDGDTAKYKNKSNGKNDSNVDRQRAKIATVFKLEFST